MSERILRPSGKEVAIYTQNRLQSKALILLMKVEKKLLETEFLIAICRLTGDKWQPKTLFLAILIRVCQLLKERF